MVFSTRNQGTIRSTVDNMELNEVSACKYLGITLDEELEWRNCIDIVCSKLITFVGIFYKLQIKLPSVVLQAIYYAFVHSHNLYGIKL
jgi:hypothetical protein